MKYRFQFRRYALTFRVPMRTAHGPWTTREGVIVRLDDASGKSGYGEAAPIPWFGTETVDEVEAICRELGRDVDAERLENIPANAWCLRGAVAAARAMLGSTEAKGVASYLPVAALLPAGRPALADVASKAERGFRTFKWKVGVGEMGDELALLDDLVAALPPGAKLRLDANGAWDRRRAEKWLERCAERPVEFIEQPVDAAARGAEDLLLGLAGDFPTPLALDESVTRTRDVERWVGLGWPGFFVIKSSLLDDADAALGRLKAAKARVVFSSALETAIGAQAALRRALAYGGEARALGFGVYPLFRDTRFDALPPVPFVRAEDVAVINPEALWNALN